MQEQPNTAKASSKGEDAAMTKAVAREHGYRRINTRFSVHDERQYNIRWLEHTS